MLQRINNLDIQAVAYVLHDVSHRE